MKPWLQYLLAFVIFCHGFIYLRVGSILPTAVPRWNGSSWLLGDAVSGSQLTTLVIVVHVLAGALIVAAALAVAWPAAVPGLWVPLAIGGGAIGAVAFAMFWDGNLALFVDEGGIGAVISVLLALGAIVFRHALH